MHTAVATCERFNSTLREMARAGGHDKASDQHEALREPNLARLDGKVGPNVVPQLPLMLQSGIAQRIAPATCAVDLRGVARGVATDVLAAGGGSFSIR